MPHQQRDCCQWGRCREQHSEWESAGESRGWEGKERVGKEGQVEEEEEVEKRRWRAMPKRQGIKRGLGHPIS
jgi:hypothetical protein